eukprot:TRINITY_DN51473_c0_g1_i2.p1 TRINITY_DN51473_c0_g1~~TRINITY_DN51473_c0_g1_i2.p1  ORF type:complete len:278 (+),score=-4.42 TRINITY_DN51473_c0_g1_i2:187-1020(+)
MYRRAIQKSLEAATRSCRRIAPAAPSRHLHGSRCAPVDQIARSGPCGTADGSIFQTTARAAWMHPSLAVRAMSTSASDAGLLKALKGELDFEEKNYEAPQDLASGAPGGFTVEEKAGTMDAVLRRTFHGEQIEVVATFGDDDMVDDEEGDEGEAEGEGDEEEQPERLTPLTARVTVTKQGSDPTLEFDCVVDGNSWIIQDVRLADPAVPEEGMPYGGPAFATLDPTLQDQFEAYLNRRGFSPALADYLRRHLADKEQREYMRWLSRLGAFVSHGNGQ